MKYSRQEMEDALSTLIKQEKPVFAVCAAIVGTVPALLFLELMAHYAFVGLLVAGFAFPAIIALFARFVGRLYSISARIPIALWAGMVYLASGYLFSAKPMWYLISPVPFGIAFMVSRRSLDRVQTLAVAEHAIKPFDDLKPRTFINVTVPIFTMIALPGAIYIGWSNLTTPCANTLNAGDYHGAVPVCTNQQAQKVEDIIASGNSMVHHSFGSLNQMSSEAEVLYKSAMLGHPEAQVLWWAVLEYVYGNQAPEDAYLATARWHERQAGWRELAANQGYDAAVSLLAIGHRYAGIQTEASRQQAIDFASALLEKGTTGADALLAAAQKLVTIDHVEAHYAEQLRHPERLDKDALENLIASLEGGEYYYDIHDLNELVPRRGYYNDFIPVKVDPARALELLDLLSRQFNHTEASFRLFQLARESGAGADEYLQRAARQGHRQAQALWGVTLYCRGQKIDGVVMLKRAAEAGHELANTQRREIAKTQSLSACL